MIQDEKRFTAIIIADRMISFFINTSKCIKWIASHFVLAMTKRYKVHVITKCLVVP